jgi:ubiquinone/menaquinone biosynthesis C-methylase UbiE
MIERILEPEAMDSEEEAREYDAMDHAEVNQRFVADFLESHGPCREGEILDVGTGTAQIPMALCRRDPRARVVAIDVAAAMLDLARRNVEAARLTDRIMLRQVDAKKLREESGAYEAVISNSIVHHLAKPAPVIHEMARLVAPGATLFVRDLCRPASATELQRLVQVYAGNETEKARRLFDDSLHAALTCEELQVIVRDLGLPAATVRKTSDRHWTLSWKRGGHATT